ncbi:MAG: hypothetical protein RR548_01545 [Carnobacterium sp.]|uniref:Tetratricopeptide repeat protein n=1 Tax=Carnobacterium antarcticum TaxID=2126436 RepID=A0ABW4NPJ7_9LACT|nr:MULTISPECIES: hypothetical protein [unclassified Carnobacterium]ALV22742.1 hypothetical protein NY10_2155 [Carnobacterium sp. CP1]QQP70638.1 hypothetical protein JHE06_02110 [Carnobacterium sp. CS13]
MANRRNKTATIIQFNPTSDFYFQRGIKAFQKNDMSRAKTYLLRAATLSKNEEEKVFALCQLAICHQHTGEFTESIDILEELIEKSGDIFPEAYYFQSNNYAFLDELETALELVVLYLELEPDGDFLEEAEDLKETIELELNGF